jgi:hypothetical protein
MQAAQAHDSKEQRDHSAIACHTTQIPYNEAELVLGTTVTGCYAIFKGFPTVECTQAYRASRVPIAVLREGMWRSVLFPVVGTMPEGDVQVSAAQVVALAAGQASSHSSGWAVPSTTSATGRIEYGFFPGRDGFAAGRNQGDHRNGLSVSAQSESL